jgi:hypothetical protein
MLELGPGSKQIRPKGSDFQHWAIHQVFRLGMLKPILKLNHCFIDAAENEKGQVVNTSC